MKKVISFLKKNKKMILMLLAIVVVIYFVLPMVMEPFESKENQPVHEEDGVKANDIVTIPSKKEENKVVSVFGEVRRPGAIRMPESRTRMSLVIGLAGGLSEFASSKIRVIRHLSGNVTKKYVVDFDEILKGNRREDLLVRGGDLIIVDSGW